MQLKRVIIAASLLFLSSAVWAQSPQNFAAGGVSFQPGNAHQFAGTAIYAHLLNSPDLAAFTVLDAIPQTRNPFTVTTNVGTGIATRVFMLRGIDIWMPTSAGVSWSGTNTGWQWSTGALAKIPVKGFFIAPNVRILKSSVNNASGLNQTGYQITGGILFGLPW